MESELMNVPETVLALVFWVLFFRILFQGIKNQNKTFRAVKKSPE